MRSTALLGVLCLTTVLACGGDDASGPDTGNGTPTVTAVEVTPGTATLVSFEQTTQLTASAKDAAGSVISGKAFTWSSSDENIATVSSTGLVTAVANGSATITATADGVNGTATVEVDQTAAQLAIQTEPSGAEAGTPFTVQPVVEVHDANGNLVASDNTTVVTGAIDSGGGTLGGTTAATAVAGVATFTDLQLTGPPPGDRILSFTAPNLTPATSGVFSLSCGPSGIVSWWPGEGDASDVVGPNDGTLNNGVTYAAGKVGQAFSFDGVDDEFGSDATGMNDLQQLTVEAWVMHESLPRQIQRYVTVSGASVAVLRYDGASGPGQLHFFMVLDGSLRHIRANDVLQVGVFHHVAGTYNGSVMRLFLDGVEVANVSVSGTVGDMAFVNLSMSDEALDGLLDEVSIYDRALTAAEILEIFAAGSAGKCGD